MRRLRYFWLSSITSELLCALSTTPWQWLCVTADIMWFLLSPRSEADDGDFWALLCSPATAMTEIYKKKMLEHDDQWHFSHGFEIPQSVPCCPGLSEGKMRSQSSAWIFLVWVFSSLGIVTSAPTHWQGNVAASFLTYSKWCSLQYILVCFTVLSWVYSDCTKGIHRMSLLL